MSQYGENPRVLGALSSSSWPSFAHCGVGERAFSHQPGDRQVTLTHFCQKFSFSKEFLQYGVYSSSDRPLQEIINSFIHWICDYTLLCARQQKCRDESYSLSGLSAASQLGELPGHRQMCSHYDEGKAQLQGPRVDSPPSPDCWGMLTTGMFSFPRRFPLKSFHHAQHSFHASESYCKVLALELFQTFNSD